MKFKMTVLEKSDSIMYDKKVSILASNLLHVILYIPRNLINDYRNFIDHVEECSNTYNNARDRCVDFLVIKVLHDVDGIFQKDTLE